MIYDPVANFETHPLYSQDITGASIKGGQGTVLPNGVKVAVSDRNQKCQKQTKVGSACSLQLYSDVGLRRTCA